MEKVELISDSARDTERAAAKVAGELRAGDVILLAGDVGTGKSTFVRAACRRLGVEENVASPSFTIGRTYTGDLPVSHVDLFRLDSLAGEDPALLDDYLSPASVVFVEWPQPLESGLEPERVALRLHLSHLGEDRRGFTVSGRPDLVSAVHESLRNGSGS